MLAPGLLIAVSSVLGQAGFALDDTEAARTGGAAWWVWLLVPTVLAVCVALPIAWGAVRGADVGERAERALVRRLGLQPADRTTLKSLSAAHGQASVVALLACPSAMNQAILRLAAKADTPEQRKAAEAAAQRFGPGGVLG